MDVEKDNIKKGFNRGYMLARHSPELTELLSKGLQDKNDSYIKGLQAGVKEYASEKSQVKIIGRNKNYKIDRNHIRLDKSRNKDVTKKK